MRGEESKAGPCFFSTGRVLAAAGGACVSLPRGMRVPMGIFSALRF